MVPAFAVCCGTGMAAVVNLTNEVFGGDSYQPDVIVPTSGASFSGGFIEGALFRDPSVDGSAGSGVFRDLYRLSPPNTKGVEVESGYNRVEMDSSIPNGFDPYIRVGDLIEDASRESYIFVIDINESNNKERYLSLDDFKVWVGDSTDPEVLPGSLAELGSTLGIPAYDMNASGIQNHVLMDATLSTGSGGGDLFVFVPKAFFGNAAADSYVYLYTSLGAYTGDPGFGAGATQEQVSIPGKTIIGDGSGTTLSTISAGTTVPESGMPAMLALAAGVGLALRRR